MSLVITANIVLAAITFTVIVAMILWSIRAERPQPAERLASAPRTRSQVTRPVRSLARQS